MLIGAFILTMLIMPISISAADKVTLNRFVYGNIIPQNAKFFGLNSADEIDGVVFGTPLKIGQISEESIAQNVNGEYSVICNEQFIPVLKEGVVKFFVMVDSSGTPVSMGYKTLADELIRISKMYSVDINNISIYKSLSINAFLFSVPSVRYENLTILKKDWDKTRSELSTLEETLALLVDASKGVK